MPVNVAVASEKGNRDRFFVAPHDSRGRVAALMPDGTLEKPPPKTYPDGRPRKEYPPFREGHVIAVAVCTGPDESDSKMWYAVVKEVHGTNMNATIELFSNQPYPPHTEQFPQLPGTNEECWWRQVLILPVSIPAGRVELLDYWKMTTVRGSH
eukprot:7644973-Heterocapsa_arctica.AAC.1